MFPVLHHHRCGTHAGGEHEMSPLTSAGVGPVLVISRRLHRRCCRTALEASVEASWAMVSGVPSTGGERRDGGLTIAFPKG